MFDTIGYFYSRQQFPYDAGRQPTAANTGGYLELKPHRQFEQALIGLNEIERIWIIFNFHNNLHWKPMVRPPRGSKKKVGVFATRAPYRPNPIGISAVTVLKVEGLKIFVGPCDLLNGTPILDIKPYLSYCDSFPESKVPWLDCQEQTPFPIFFEDEVLKIIADLYPLPIQEFIQNQLSFDPLDKTRKRLQKNEDHWVLCYRTWRIHYRIREKVLNMNDEEKGLNSEIQIFDIQTGYSPSELEVSSEDPYQDKDLHRSVLLKRKKLSDSSN